MSNHQDFAEQRRHKIAELVRREGSVRLADLAEPFGVSEPTLRKDLSALERDGVLRRTHGGAIAVESRPVSTLAARKAHNIEAKRAIARICADLVEEGQSVYLDSGTTIEVMAGLLRRSTLNVLTNSPGVAMAVAEKPGVRHTLLGGEYNPVGGSVTGALTVETLERFHVDTAFIGVSGISPQGIFTVDVAESHVKRAAIGSARRVVVPLDTSKVGYRDYYQLTDLAHVDDVVSERRDADLARWCEEHGVRLHTP
ncbi:DeoR/GlpR family DNA-binding transcription regulator [Rothia sp. AR01]|uniref:DeoR/GlpR family DNA-binding transcription regulator n=1 Tax=Rothia santali TaxID=2949643 RepID=A0A9X2KK41_9MICC|nr:DeoR/GlpR family DNA-binding transcription regulator [Rothia santali]MCP3424631.1 DeoR/GlpR family DNA-binding transcription regulator [Rothia santali]